MHQHCDNCHATWIQDAKFCYQCGQDHHQMPMSFKHFVLEFLESTLHFETKNVQMIKLLFTNPGLIVKEFNQNKRARYVNPIRLYIFLGFIFFLTTNIHMKKEEESLITIKNADTSKVSFKANSDSNQYYADSIFQNYQGDLYYDRVDSIAQASKIEISNMEKIGYVITNKVSHNKIYNDSIRALFFKYMNNSLLILIPIFAFVVLLLIGYKKNYYQSALIYALYLHCLIFFLLTIKNAIHLLNVQFDILFYVAIIFYLNYSLKVAFDLKWRRSIFNAFLLLFTYLTILSISSASIMLYIIVFKNI